MISTLHYSSHKRHTSSTSVRAHIDDPRAASQRKRTLKKPIATSRAAARAHVPRAARVPRARPAPTHARIKYNINTRAHPPSRAITAPPASRASPANDRRKMVLGENADGAKTHRHPSRALPRTRAPYRARTHARERWTYLSCCQTPTQEYVVPRSIPIAGPSTLLMMCFSFSVVS